MENSEICIKDELDHQNETVDLLKKVLLIDPKNEINHIKLGNIFFAEGKYEEALHSFQNALKINFKNIDTLFNQALTYTALNSFDLAEKTYIQILTINNKDIETYKNLGKLYYSKGEVEKAQNCYLTSIELNNVDPEIYNNLASIYYFAKDFDKSTYYWEETIKLFPNYIEGHYNLAVAYADLNRTNDSIQIYYKIIEKNPNHFESFYNLANLLKKVGDFENSTKFYKKVIALNPTFTEAYFNLANTYKTEKKFKKAIDLYLQILDLNPNDANATHNLIFTYLEVKNFGKVITLCEEILKKNPENKVIHHMLQSLTGSTTESAPKEYVTSLFDGYAHDFDEHLVNVLDYQMPQKLRTMLDKYLRNETHKFKNTLDLGCGTGLSGLKFRDISENITGIDISSKMIEIAKSKNIYDQHVIVEIEEYLQSCQEEYDLFVATDVFVYMGKLDNVFYLIKKIATPNSYFIFSVESLKGNSYFLNKSGRYSHSINYLKNLAKINDFKVVGIDETKLRNDKDGPIMGNSIILKIKD